LLFNWIEKRDATREINIKLGLARKILMKSDNESVRLSLKKIDEIGTKNNDGIIIISHITILFDKIIVSSGYPRNCNSFKLPSK
jgi:hypothetical protein